MKYLSLEVLKLRKKTRSWLGPILVFWLIMLAYPLTIEVSPKNLEIGFFFSAMDSYSFINDVCD